MNAVIDINRQNCALVLCVALNKDLNKILLRIHKLVKLNHMNGKHLFCTCDYSYLY